MPSSIGFRLAIVISGIVAAQMLNVGFAEAEPYLGSPNISHLRTLKGELGIKSSEPLMEAYLKSYPYNMAVNLLVDGAMQAQGTKWCLPSDALTAPLGRVFWQILVPEALRVIDTAPHDDLAINAVVSQFAQKFPCSRT